MSDRTPSLGLVEATPVRRFVEVAVDAAGGGGNRTYTYHVPERLADLQLGEAVLVEYGRRQALAIVLAEAADVPGVATKPILERVRADGPLLPPLSIALARWLSATYVAPPAIVLRAMLPPGVLERLELVAELAPAGGGGVRTREGPEMRAEPSAGPADGGDMAILDQLLGGPRAVRDLHAAEGRPALIRRLRGLAERGAIGLDWTLRAATAGPRFERRVHLAAEPSAPPAAARARLGARQLAAMEELTAAGRDGLPAARLADRHGSSVLPGLVRRGLVEVEVRRRVRRPLATRPPGLRGGRPAGSDLTSEQSAAVELIRQSIASRDATPLLLDGVTGAGKTAVYIEAIGTSLDAGRPVLLLVPEIALALPLVDRLRADLAASVALVHSGLGAGERADEWRRIRAGEVEIVVGTRLAVLAPLGDVGLIIVDEEHEAAYKSDRTPRLQARDTAIELGVLAGAAVVLGSATPSVETLGRARLGA
jgi:primosomal protein N' (replication factor Y)